MINDSKDTYYRQLNYPTTEFKWARRKGPGLPFILEVRATGDHELKTEFEVMDIAACPIGAYLRLAETKFVEIMEKRVQDDKRKKSEQFDRSEQRRVDELEKTIQSQTTEKKQLEGSVGEPERETEGSLGQEDSIAGDDKVRLDRFSEPLKKKRGRPRKDRSASGKGTDTRDSAH